MAIAQRYEKAPLGEAGLEATNKGKSASRVLHVYYIRLLPICPAILASPPRYLALPLLAGYWRQWR
jgi:hypothetical protein